MPDRDTRRDGVAEETGQALVGFLTNDDWDALLVHVNGLIQEMESLPAGEGRDRVFELLDGIDALHREALHRLVRLFKEGVLEKVVSDPAIHTLMELYDLLPPEAEQPQPEARKATSRLLTIPIKAIPATPPAPARYPHWIPFPETASQLASGSVMEIALERQRVLLCRRDDKWFALESRCARDGASLREATLSAYTLTCPNHPGCYYDVRQGSRLGGNERIACYPVRNEADGRLLIGFDMDFRPDLPSF